MLPESLGIGNGVRKQSILLRETPGSQNESPRLMNPMPDGVDGIRGGI